MGGMVESSWQMFAKYTVVYFSVRANLVRGPVWWEFWLNPAGKCLPTSQMEWGWLSSNTDLNAHHPGNNKPIEVIYSTLLYIEVLLCLVHHSTLDGLLLGTTDVGIVH
jgi:hypothetical protein